MKEIDYTTLDDAIVAKLQAGPRFLVSLFADEVMLEAKALQVENSPDLGGGFGSGRPTFRFVDARLQALRKKGVIAYSGKTGWTLTSPCLLKDGGDGRQ